MNKKMVVDPDVMLSKLLSLGFVEPSSDPFSPYKISTNPQTNRPYTINIIAYTIYPKGKQSHKKAICREIKKCLLEYHIHYLSLREQAALRVEMLESLYTKFEEMFNLDLSSIPVRQRKTIAAYYSGLKKKNLPDIDLRMKAYLLRRLNQKGDLRTGKRFKMNIETINEVISENTSPQDQRASFQPEDMSATIQALSIRSPEVPID